MRINTIISFCFAVVCIASCGENREVNSNDGPNFNEIHEDIHYHFDKVAIEGSEYFILERDRNNPHEGFGFMALTGNDLKANQDSIKAYLKTILELQIKQSSNGQNGEEQVRQYADDLFSYYLEESKSPFRIQNKTEDNKKAKE